MSDEIRPILPGFLDPGILHRTIYPDLEHHYYWTNDWNPSFYAALARAGFISVCHDWGEPGILLLPELQKDYAVLDWDHKLCPRSFSRKLRSGWLETEKFSLKISSKIAGVCEGIAGSYGSENWLLPPYRALLEELCRIPQCGLELFAVELYSGLSGELVAGEIGYTIGATYTSLSGFVADRGRFSGAGTLQMLALSLLLERSGYGFWNFGHPYMQYKLDLGCRVLPRADFLERWAPAIGIKPALSLQSSVGTTWCCAELLEGVSRP